MTLPAFLLGGLIATLYGALYHLARGGAAWRLLLYLLLAWAGFASGHLIASLWGWTVLQVGPLNLGPATIGSLFFLAIGDWLSRVERPAR
ncbi:MAG: hypothetical protein ACM3QS_09325 [Bacteroidota bacterium]